MLSPETLEHYRRMSIPERFKLVLRMMDEGMGTFWKATRRSSSGVSSFCGGRTCAEREHADRHCSHAGKAMSEPE